VCGAERHQFPGALRFGQRRTQPVLEIVQFVNGHAAVDVLVERLAAATRAPDIHGLCQLAAIGATGQVFGGKLEGASNSYVNDDDQRHPGNDFRGCQPRRQSPGPSAGNLRLRSVLDAGEGPKASPTR
jgi:hypothetical protein